jgi:hypothetical protein
MSATTSKRAGTISAVITPSRPHHWWSVSLLCGVIGVVTTRTVTTGEVSEVDLRTARWGEPGSSTVNVSVVGRAELFTGLTDGDEVVVLGTPRRRFFRSGGATVSRTEVEVHRIMRLSKKREVSKTIGEVQTFLAAIMASG